MLYICLTVGLVVAGQAQTQDKDVETRPWAVIARRHAMAAKVYPTADPSHPFAPLKGTGVASGPGSPGELEGLGLRMG